MAGVKIVVYVASVLLFTSSANAEKLCVPCEKYKEVTGKSIDCSKTPIVNVDSHIFNSQRAAIDLQESYYCDTPPWKDPDVPAAKMEEGNDDCNMPPWRRNPDLKCD